MIDLNQATAELESLLASQKDWTKELRSEVADFLWKYASDRLLRNLADLMGHSEVAPKRIVMSVKGVRPLVGLVPTADFLKTWRQAVEQEQADLRYIAWRDEDERQRRASNRSAP
jgi:ABC-type phosphate/phosphonate transport system substrate-binding protein